jgi:hypothetical protein
LAGGCGCCGCGCDGGFGIFSDLSCNRIEFSIGAPWLGFELHLDINLNTGIGARNGNLELSFLGFGVKLGADGLEVNTPWIGGYNCGVPVILLILVISYCDTAFCKLHIPT